MKDFAAWAADGTKNEDLLIVAVLIVAAVFLIVGGGWAWVKSTLGINNFDATINQTVANNPTNTAGYFTAVTGQQGLNGFSGRRFAGAEKVGQRTVNQNSLLAAAQAQ